MSTITMSRTWQSRIGRGRGLLRQAAIAVVTLFAVFGFAASLKVFFSASHPDSSDVAAIANRAGNQRAAAGQFAADFVAAVLTTPSSKQSTLQRFITLSESDRAFAAAQSAPPPPAVINTPKVWSVVPNGSVGDVDLYGVVVVVQQRSYASAEAASAFYGVPVAVWHYQPRAMDWPVPMSNPGPGADVKQGYDHPLSPSSPVYPVVSGFINTYLTATSGLDRYVVADSWIKPIGGYQSAVIKNADTATEVPDAPAPGTRVHVRARVVAQTSQFAALNFTFPLTVENNGGTWMVTSIDSIPQLSNNSNPVPATSTHN
ncbi:conjugal transfer protein [Mycobacterium sp. 050272]|uniref:conjugal transfer protein n=2 Tax=unclassified Mycobacterium TaxID=2642494 RepID=UPI003190D683